MHRTIVTMQTSNDLKISKINLFVIIYKQTTNKLHFDYNLSIFFFEHVIFESLFAFHLFQLFLLLCLVLFENFHSKFHFAYYIH